MATIQLPNLENQNIQKVWKNMNSYPALMLSEDSRPWERVAKLYPMPVIPKVQSFMWCHRHKNPATLDPKMKTE